MKSEKGFSLIEVAIAIALLGIVAVTILLALAGGSNAIMLADEQATAESLARAAMEYVGNQEYDADNNPPVYILDEDEFEIPPGYDVFQSAERLDPNGDGTDTDDGIQRITVLVYHPYDAGNPEGWVVRLEGYRTAR